MSVERNSRERLKTCLTNNIESVAHMKIDRVYKLRSWKQSDMVTRHYNCKVIIKIQLAKVFFLITSGLMLPNSIRWCNEDNEFDTLCRITKIEHFDDFSDIVFAYNNATWNYLIFLIQNIHFYRERYFWKARFSLYMQYMSDLGK